MTVVTEDSDIRIDKLQLGPFGTNAYIITCAATSESVLVDTPDEAGTILEALSGTRPR